jgi:hypothetical protein
VTKTALTGIENWWWGGLKSPQGRRGRMPAKPQCGSCEKLRKKITEAQEAED